MSVHTRARGSGESSLASESIFFVSSDNGNVSMDHARVDSSRVRPLTSTRFNTSPTASCRPFLSSVFWSPQRKVWSVRCAKRESPKMASLLTANPASPIYPPAPAPWDTTYPPHLFPSAPSPPHAPHPTSPLPGPLPPSPTMPPAGPPPQASSSQTVEGYLYLRSPPPAPTAAPDGSVSTPHHHKRKDLDEVRLVLSSPSLI